MDWHRGGDAGGAHAAKASKMSAPLILSFVWLVVANVAGMLPSKDAHWRVAYGLIALGLPLLGWLVLSDGWVISALVFVAGASVLRWPLRYFMRWLRATLARAQAKR